MKTIKILCVTGLVIAAACKAAACWYQKTNYNDYIFSINNIERHTSLVKTIEAGSQRVNSITYTVVNNMVVDFPLTVIMKLTSENPIMMTNPFNGGSGVRAIPVEAKLQWRVLPDGDWVTASEFQIDSGRLPNSYPPAPYLGRNNICPKGLKAGDKIMIRLYVTDNAGWQSGDPSSMCDENEYWKKDKIEYTITNKAVPNVDMGGNWYPHYVVVVQYSGYTRPVQ